LRTQAGQSRPLVIGYEAGDATLQLVAERIVLNARECGLQAVTSSTGEQDMVVRRVALPSPEAFTALSELAERVHTVLNPTGSEVDDHFHSERELLAQGNLIPLVYVPKAYSIAERVRGVNVDDCGRLDLAGAWLEESR
jgi:hypothetical protein